MEKAQTQNYFGGSQRVYGGYTCVTLIYIDVNCRITNNLHARDLLMLLCQDEIRNSSRKLNAAKKLRGEVVKLGRRRLASNEDDAHQSKG